MKKRIAILSDRYHLLDSFINQGDKALTLGTYVLIKNKIGINPISGGWKNFPYFNIKTIRKSKSNNLEDTYEKAFLKILSNSKRRKYIFAYWLFSRSFLVNNPLFNWIDGLVKKYNTQGIIDTIAPYIFRRIYAYNFIEHIKNADSVIFNGGGIIADHIIKYAPTYILEVYIAKRMGKKVVAVNLSISAHTELLKNQISFFVKQVDFFMLREPCSEELLLKSGISREKIEVCPDFAFVAPQKTLQENKIELDNTAAILIRGDRVVNYQFWNGVIKYLTIEKKMNVFFIHTCKAHDKKVYNSLKKRFQISALDFDYDYRTVIQILRKADLTITDRYHGVIFSLLAHTPVIAIEATTHKINGLFKLFEYPIPVFKPAIDNSSPEISNWIDFIIENREDLKNRITNVTKAMVIDINKKFKTIVDLIKD